MLGTASEAISRLALPAAEIERLQANMATAYSVTYLFGLVAIVVVVTQIGPLLLGSISARPRLRSPAISAPRTMPARRTASPEIVSRSFRVGPIAGSTVGAFENSVNGVVTIDQVGRGSRFTKATTETLLEPDDIVLVLGRRRSVIAVSERLGAECRCRPATMSRWSSARSCWCAARSAGAGSAICAGSPAPSSGARRLHHAHQPARPEHPAPCPASVLKQGDILTLYGSEDAIIRAAPSSAICCRRARRRISSCSSGIGRRR